MTLYLANPSTQNHQFQYREPVNNLVHMVDIGSGRQTEIGHGWTAEQQARVIAQLERNGARDAAEAHGKMGKFSGLLYRDRGIIEADEIEMAHEAELQTREDRSVTAATAGALGFDHTVRKRSNARPSARITETKVQQDIAPGARPKGTEVAFDLTVDPDGRSDVKLPV